jgi:hypothetical protein
VEKQRWIKFSTIIAAILIGGGLTYYFLGSAPKRELNAVMKELSIKTAKQLSQELPRIQSLEDVLVVSIVGGRDEDKRLQNIINDEVANVRKYTIKDWPYVKKRLASGPLFGQALEKLGFIDDSPPKSLEQAIGVIPLLRKSNIKIDGVLIIKGEFDQGKSDDALGASVKMTARFFDMKKKEELKDKQVVVRNGIDSAWNLLYLTHKLDSYGFFARFLLWVLVVCLQPWIFINLCRMVIKSRRNDLNAILLGGFTFVDTALAWPLLMTLVIPGLLGVTFLVIIAGITAYYNYDAMDYIDRRLL